MIKAFLCWVPVMYVLVCMSCHAQLFTWLRRVCKIGRFSDIQKHLEFLWYKLVMTFGLQKIMYEKPVMAFYWQN